MARVGAMGAADRAVAATMAAAALPADTMATGAATLAAGVPWVDGVEAGATVAGARREAPTADAPAATAGSAAAARALG